MRSNSELVRLHQSLRGTVYDALGEKLAQAIEQKLQPSAKPNESRAR